MSEFKGKTIKENVEVLKNNINNTNELYKKLEKVSESLNKSISTINDQTKEFNKFTTTVLKDINAFNKESMKEFNTYKDTSLSNFDSFSNKTTNELSNLNNRITNFEALLSSIELKQNEMKSHLGKIEHQIQEEKTNNKHRNTINRIIITTGFIFAIAVPIILFVISNLSR